MNTGRSHRSKIELAMIGHNKLVALLVVVAQQVLSTTHVAKERHDISVSYRNEVGARVVVTYSGKAISFDELVDIFPCRQVFRPKQRGCAKGLAIWWHRLPSCRHRIIHVILFPNTGIKNAVRCGESCLCLRWYYRTVHKLLPTEQQRII